MTNIAPKMKLDNSPTPPVELIGRCKRFLIRQMTVPLNGHIAKEPISAGSSEKSSLIKDGIIGMLNSNIISTNAMAESMAVMVMYRTFTGFFLVFII